LDLNPITEESRAPTTDGEKVTFSTKMPI